MDSAEVHEHREVGGFCSPAQTLLAILEILNRMDHRLTEFADKLDQLNNRDEKDR